MAASFLLANHYIYYIDLSFNNWQKNNIFMG